MTILFAILSWATGLYVGGWCIFAQSIISACAAYDNGTLTGAVVGWTIVKCVLAPLVIRLVTCVVAILLGTVQAVIGEMMD